LGDSDEETRELVRKAMVGVFTELGVDHPLSRTYRRRLATALY
jgi:thioredoxin-like negative regulator of GroEL